MEIRVQGEAFQAICRNPRASFGLIFRLGIYEWDVADGAPADWDPAIDGPIILEIKNKDYFAIHGRESHWNADDRDAVIAPDGIELQMQQQLDVADRRRSMLLVLCAGNDLLSAQRERNDQVVQLIRSGVADFWKSVEDNDPPPADYTRDYDTLRGVFGRRGFVGSVADEDQDRASHLVRTALSAKQTRLDADKAEKAAQAELIDIMGGETDLILDDGSQLKWMPNKRGTMLWNMKVPSE